MHSWLPVALVFAWILDRGWFPTLVMIYAIVHVVRTGSSKWWILPIVAVPLAGPIAYFLMTRSAWGVPIEDERRTRARGAKARLARLETQLTHWRGPAVLAESAEELLTLRRFSETEARFREARAAGATIEDVNMGFSETMIAMKRPAEAVPVLRELLAAQPDFRLGAAQLLLARCLDEMGKLEEAEAALRLYLTRRSLPEVKARLARILVLRGQRDEGLALAKAVSTEYDATPPKLRRSHVVWMRLARRVLRGNTRLPRAAHLSPGRPWGWILGLAVLAVAGIVWLVVWLVN